MSNHLVDLVDDQHHHEHNDDGTDN